MTNPTVRQDDPQDNDDPGVRAGTGESIDSGKGRIFPCDECGADLEFSIGAQSLKCPYCGAVKTIETPEDAPIVEQDYQAMIVRLKQLRMQGHDDEAGSADEHAIRCESCGAEVVFQGTLTSTHCPYCASPLQRDKIHDAPTRIPVDGLLPFQVTEPEASANLRAWVKSLWWAPNEFLRQGAGGKFNGIYLPYFTFDSLTFTRYSGQRGDHYYVTVGEGKDRRTERRTRWSFASGQFQRFFDDVLIVAESDQVESLVQRLEPWPLANCVPFNQQFLAGFFARTYDLPLEDGFGKARQRIEAELTNDVRKRIGGDEQSITSQQTNYSAITFKHLLLPVWLLAYRYKEKPYRVMINAVTGEVSGERPYSIVKILFAVLVAVVLGLGIWLMANRGGTPSLQGSSHPASVRICSDAQADSPPTGVTARTRTRTEAYDIHATGTASVRCGPRSFVPWI
jgi:predicted RNA-binding Zn-ribbon protein involved in translation (DUF1610 family)